MKNCSASESDALSRSTQMTSSTRTRGHRGIVHDGKDCLLSKQHKIQIMYLWSLETICKHNKQVKRIWHHQTETLDCGVSQQGTNVSGDLWTFSHWSNLPHRNDFRTKTRPSARYRKTPAASVRACLMSLLKGEQWNHWEGRWETRTLGSRPEAQNRSTLLNTLSNEASERDFKVMEIEIMDFKTFQDCNRCKINTKVVNTKLSEQTLNHLNSRRSTRPLKIQTQLWEKHLLRPCLHWCVFVLKWKRSSCTLAFFLLRFRNDLGPHYTTKNSSHMTIHAGTTIDM